MLDLVFPKENALIQLPVLLRNTPAGKATYTKLAPVGHRNDTPVIVGFDIIKQGFFSLDPDGDYLHFHYELKRE